MASMAAVRLRWPPARQTLVTSSTTRPWRKVPRAHATSPRLEQLIAVGGEAEILTRDENDRSISRIGVGRVREKTDPSPSPAEARGHQPLDRPGNPCQGRADSTAQGGPRRPFGGVDASQRLLYCQ
jgi:hypothetical protein